MRTKLLYFHVALAMGLSGVSHAASIIDTTGSWNGTDAVSSFGETDTATYGQTFTVTGPETVLDSFTFYLDDYLNPDFVDFQAYVYAWDGSKASGSALYSSSALSTTNNGGLGGFEAFTINTGGIDLADGLQYVAFFSASNLFDGSHGQARWGLPYNISPYSGGSFVYLNNGSNFGQITTNTWENFDSYYDLAFTMNFSEPVVPVVPVPAAAPLGLLGLGLVAAFNRRRKQRNA